MHNRPLNQAEIKDVCLAILLAFDEYCKKHDLTYFLAYGSLLGAARHGGFIPWDDDIDVMMPLKDYKKLLELHDLGVDLPYPYRLASGSIPTSNHHIWFPKVYDSRTSCHQSYLKRSLGREQGAWIDIFPIFGLPEDNPERVLASFSKLEKQIERRMCAVSSLAKRARELLRIIREGGHCYNWLIEQHELLLLSQCDISESSTCVDPCWPHVKYDSSLFESSVLLEFENHLLPAPKYYEEVLTAGYGDWKTPPPERDRIPHICEIQWKP